MTEQFNNLIVFGLLLIAGVLGEQLAQRIRYLPRITGFILAGVLLGPDVSGALSAELLDNAGVFVDIALGLVLYQLGLLLDVRTVWGDRALLLSSVWESIASFALVFLTLLLLRIPPLPAALTAVAGNATAQ